VTYLGVSAEDFESTVSIEAGGLRAGPIGIAGDVRPKTDVYGQQYDSGAKEATFPGGRWAFQERAGCDEGPGLSCNCSFGRGWIG